MRNDHTLRWFTVTVTSPERSDSVFASGSKALAKVAARSPAPLQTEGVFGSNPVATVTGTNVEATLTSMTQTSGQFSFQVTGLPGGQYVVQETTDLTHWISVQTNNAPFAFQTSTTDGSSQRFYRAFYLP